MGDEAPGRSRWVGRVLRDKWRIDARLARGGVGTVFAATHRNNGNRVAIKVLHPEFSRAGDTRSRFLQEGYAANQVSHPGVVRILDDDVTEEGLAFLVMELLEGELLEQRRVRKGGTLPLEEVYEVADQLLDVLAAAHDKGIVHRDIKPDNLFLTREGRLKVLDFGFAQMKSGFRQEQTATGYLLGTPGFMSPEQAVGDRAQVDAQTDVWAVGATLFTLLSGQPVHEGESAAEMLVAAANVPARSVATVAPGLPPRLVSIVDRALAFEKRDRWPNARSMQVALRGVPGRQPRAFEAGRRSLPDAGPSSLPAHSEDPTVARAAPDVEELDASELVDAKPSWQTDPGTVMAEPGRPLPAAALPSAITRHVPAGAIVDDDGPTLHVPSTIDMEAPPPTPQMPGRPSAAGVVASEGGTVIMDSSPAMGGASGSGGYPAISAPPPSPFGQGTPFGGLPVTPQAFAVGDPRMSRPDEMMFVAGPARKAPSAPGGKRVLVFLAVAAISMAIVVVTGLLVLAAAD